MDNVNILISNITLSGIFISLRDIALRMTNRTGAGIALACCHFIEQLSVCLWRHNFRMFLHLFSLLPVSPLWELSPKVDFPAHGFSHSEPLGLALVYFTFS